jgi:hypothetical protein
MREKVGIARGWTILKLNPILSHIVLAKAVKRRIEVV